MGSRGRLSYRLGRVTCCLLSGHRGKRDRLYGQRLSHGRCCYYVLFIAMTSRDVMCKSDVSKTFRMASPLVGCSSHDRMQIHAGERSIQYHQDCKLEK